MYQMYSAMMRSVKGLVSKLRRLSTLLIVLLSDWRAITLKPLSLLLFCFFCFNITELHNFEDAMGLGLVNFIWHVGEAAKICAILFKAWIPDQIRKYLNPNQESTTLYDTLEGIKICASCSETSRFLTKAD